MDKKVHYRIIIFTLTMWVLGAFFLKIETAKNLNGNSHKSTVEVRRPLRSFERSRFVFSSWRRALTGRETGALM